MADIKTRDAVKGTIKTLDKAAVASERMKSAYAKTKEKAEEGYFPRKAPRPNMRETVSRPLPSVSRKKASTSLISRDERVSGRRRKIS